MDKTIRMNCFVIRTLSFRASGQCILGPAFAGLARLPA